MTLLEFPDMGRSPRHPGKPLASPASAPEDDVPVESSAARESEPNYHYFSQALRAQRNKLGLTQVQLSVKAGVALGTVHLIEMSRQNPTLKSLVTLAEAVDLKVGDLLPQSVSPGEEALRERLAAVLEEELEAERKVLELSKARAERLKNLLVTLRKA